MKKNKLIILFIIIVLFTLPQPVHANMAAPRNSDVGSSITFVPFILVVLGALVLVIWYLRKKKKNKLNDLNK